ncbi:la-related protein 6C [Zea mays]|uniref:La-related protein 6C n=1 Tax=Zea mays TaxID=4577 RepID=A0A804LX96_MAIZE|nr:la-related protein 6C [Zea mays]|eukprot:XP_008666613.1 la-related protein 6C [Zea mays]
MAQDGRARESSSKAASAGSGGCSMPFRLNVHAREFVPVASPLAAAAAGGGYYSPFVQLSGDGGLGTDWMNFFAEPDPTSPSSFLPDFGHCDILRATGGINGYPNPKGGASVADIADKIVKQVEYQFSDTNLVANDFLTKIMNKDPEGYVPLSVISSWKKIKAMGVTSQLLVMALRTSDKLVVSDDGRKVRRAQPFTERHKEELQCRMVIAENLPQDSTRNSLEKIFGVIGSVKNIRICHPQEPGSARSSPRSSDTNTPASNKLHALIEYETSHQADRAVDKLNDERNWRKGLRVRPVLRRSPKTVARMKRPDLDHHVAASDEERVSTSDSPTATAAAHPPDNTQQQQEEEEEDQHQHQHGGAKKPWGSRGRGRPPPHSSAHSAGAPGHSVDSLAASPRHAAQGPRMPDGTRGFTMGRGRPAPPAAPSAAAAVRVV